jgi:hypothetical protein
VLEHGAFVALALLVIWVALLVPLSRGRLKAIPFGAASMFLALMIPFFWLGAEITELTILKVGSFKTNAEQATKYFDEIRSIRTKIEAEDQAVSAAVASVTALEKQAIGLKEELAALKTNDALYLDGTVAAQTIAPEIDKKSGIIKFERVVEATSKLDWNSTFTYRRWRLRCNGPSEPDSNLWSYGIIRSYGYNDIECRITP